jgi:hypothetical protein
MLSLMKGDSQRCSHFQSLVAAYSGFGGGGGGERLLGVTAGWLRAKKEGRGEESRPKGLSQIGCGIDGVMWTLIEFVRSVHLGNVTKLGESALPGGCQPFALLAKTAEGIDRARSKAHYFKWQIKRDDRSRPCVAAPKSNGRENTDDMSREPLESVHGSTSAFWADCKQGDMRVSRPPIQPKV